MTAEKALKRTERAEQKRQKRAEDKAIKDVKREIKNACDRGAIVETHWINKKYILNVKAYFDKRGYRTDVRVYQGCSSDAELWIKWGKEEEK